MPELAEGPADELSRCVDGGFGQTLREREVCSVPESLQVGIEQVQGVPLGVYSVQAKLLRPPAL